ncbi:DUF456 family protein [Cohnella sp. CFH 77786]|uniref:DUF456 domain-containing protein n=1 Tax=Cohnella sp. CFH 77786 TaxID=2662265 RepID=UPI001C60C1C7|nr:DUF456 family protein [Cohnella sp. CFH 77786]MBW5447267.1 DUF456 family protein [Cohnella sp. CFH 77786]
MDMIGWLLVTALFALGMAGAVFPVLPGALAIYAAFFVYGLFFTFAKFGFWFWTFQTLIVVLLFVADYLVNAWGVKKYGGSKASVVGSTIGILIGPFVIPGFGLIIGPLAGAVIGEMIDGVARGVALDREFFVRSLKVGWGALIGLLSSTVVKIVLQLVMIALFIIWLI